MTIDWNWFFSSFSQSAAALLGIIGAFLITRLLNSNEKVNSLINEFEDLKTSFEHIKDFLKIRRFGWYSRNVVRYDESVLVRRKMEFSNFDLGRFSYCFSDFNSVFSCLL